MLGAARHCLLVAACFLQSRSRFRFLLRSSLVLSPSFPPLRILASPSFPPSSSVTFRLPLSGTCFHLLLYSFIFFLFLFFFFSARTQCRRAFCPKPDCGALQLLPGSSSYRFLASSFMNSLGRSLLCVSAVLIFHQFWLWEFCFD